MREILPPAAVLGMAMTALPSRASEAPRMKSTCPPMPLYWRMPMVSLATCPWRSTSRQELMETMRSFCAMTRGLLT